MRYTLLLSLIFFFGNCSNQEETSKTYSKNKIANIPEASGISFCKESKTLIVANDEGSFYELSTTGKILHQQKLGDYDFEGVVCNKKTFMFAIESGTLLEVDRRTFKSKKFKLKGQGYKLTKKHGIEGIEKIDGQYYVTLQRKKKSEAKILRLKVGTTYAKVKQIINHKIIDSAGLAWHNNKLYIISDKKEKLYLYDLKHKKILKKIKLPKFAQEGITFDEEGNIYFADDNGAVFKYKEEEFGL